MRILNLLAAFCLTAVSILAANIDGTWIIAREGQKGTMEFELKLKADGANLTGTYGRKDAKNAQDIQDGKLDGDSFSFNIVQKSKKGERKVAYKGKLAGDELKGEAGIEGRRTQPFTAKRQ